MNSIIGNIVDITKGRIFGGYIELSNSRIQKITETGKEDRSQPYILPGFIDSHVHIESSLLVPSEFARLAVIHGTVGTISDPHEIANVCGMEGLKYMIDNGKNVPFHFHFGAPSCVPATIFETAGATITAEDVDTLLQQPEILYLSEMMNFPGVLFKDPEVMKKIASAKKWGKPVDGHAPGLVGDAAQTYIDAGISTDHECFTEAEALDKLSRGMKILIREGSAAKNFEALIGLINDHPDSIMFCSDDKHPDSLLVGHINQLCARAVRKGIDIFKILKAACINPVLHYKPAIGLLQPGDPADFIVVKNLTDFEVLQTYIKGILVAENGKTLIQQVSVPVINNFQCSLRSESDFAIPHNSEVSIPVIEALDGQLITNALTATPKVVNGQIVSDTENDILKIVVVNRYHDAPIVKAFIKNTGIRSGAIASSVAHDSHNIVAVGTDDHSLCMAVNEVIRHGGGISACCEGEIKILPLPVAGLMSNGNGFDIAEKYTDIDNFSKSKLGSSLQSPFMTISFMALLVIPHLKLSDKGLFDGDKFKLLV